MNRSLHVERLFSLGDYKNIKFSDEFNDIPSSIMFDNELVGRIQFLQLVNLELNFRKYLELSTKIPKGPETEMAYLEEVRVSTLNQIKSLLNGQLENRKE